MSKEIWKPGNMIFPLPAVLVTVSDNEGNDNVLTVAWTGHNMYKSGDGLCINTTIATFV